MLNENEEPGKKFGPAPAWLGTRKGGQISHTHGPRSRTLMKSIPFWFGFVGGTIGVVAGFGQQEAGFIAGIGGALGVCVGLIVSSVVRRTSDKEVRTGSSFDAEYSHERWQEHKKALNDEK